MPARPRHQSDGAPEAPSPRGDRWLAAIGILLVAWPLLLGWSIAGQPAASLMALGALLAGAATTARCGYPAAAAAAALVFGTGAIMLLPPIGGLPGLLFNFAFLTAAVLIAGHYFRLSEARSDE